MCGIFGFVGDIKPEVAKQCLDTLRHRGPDGEGLWQQPGITLGHRRLAILDLSDRAKQPMSYANERYRITYNGEIYNFVELRVELEALGFSFRSDSDTEIILAAFMAWKERCQEKFNGMWALAIWDTTEKKLFLSRDRFGKKPLFYGYFQGGFVFASEMKALFPLMPRIEANVALINNPERMFSYEVTEECVIRDIYRFPAGHYGWLSQGRLTIKRWWSTLDHLPTVPRSYEEQTEQLRVLFLDSCRLRMRSDVAIGTALSGGVDSSATISCMAKLAQESTTQRMGKDWQHAFVATFPGTPLDESHFAKKVVDHLGIPATFINIDPLQAIDKLDHYFYLFEDLYITSPIPFMLTYQAIKQHGISVTLDGHGADELFGGYGFDYLEAVKDAKWNPHQSWQVVDTFYSAWPKDAQQFNSLPPQFTFWLKRQLKAFVTPLVSSLFRRNHYQHQDVDHPRWKAFDHLNQRLYHSSHNTILPTLLRNYDRYSMASAVEIRMPFMDHRIVTFAFALPWSSKIRNGFSKAIVRDAVAPYMPQEITYRKSKIGFNSPIVNWMQGPLRDFMMDTLASQTFKECGLIDPGKVTQAVRHVIENPKAQFSDGERAWTLLTPYFWERAVLKHSANTL